MLLQISLDKISAKIDTQGAFLNELNYSNENIIYPKRTIVIDGNNKVRGGSHVCLPHFGMSEKIGQERHGFGRQLNWDILEKGDDFVKLYINPKIQDWENLYATLDYRLTPSEFLTTLEVKNGGVETFEISPAFHPYFSIENIDEVYLNGKKLEYTKKELADTIYIGKIDNIKTNKYELTITTQNLEKNAIWTDFSGDFLCVEPSYNWNAFENDEELLKVNPGEKITFLYNISIK